MPISVNRAGTGVSGGTQQHSHTVRRGESLSVIARKHQLSVQDLLDANPQIRDPDKIQPGQVLSLGTVSNQTAAPIAETAQVIQSQDSYAGGGSYTVHPGDTLSGIAAEHGTSLLGLLQANRDLADPDQIHVGDKIQLPSEATARAAQSARPASTQTFPVYAPFSPEAKDLFREAARQAGLPTSWADSTGLHKILDKESKGQVGVPNYSYGRRYRDKSQWPVIHHELRDGRIRANSSATGLGQLLLKNVDAYYPSGRQGIGNPLEEAIGMLRYIKDRYRTPDRAWQLYGTRHEGY